MKSKRALRSLRILQLAKLAYSKCDEKTEDVYVFSDEDEYSEKSQSSDESENESVHFEGNDYIRPDLNLPQMPSDEKVSNYLQNPIIAAWKSSLMEKNVARNVPLEAEVLEEGIVPIEPFKDARSFKLVAEALNVIEGDHIPEQILYVNEEQNEWEHHKECNSFVPPTEENDFDENVVANEQYRFDQNHQSTEFESNPCLPLTEEDESGSSISAGNVGENSTVTPTEKVSENTIVTPEKSSVIPKMKSVYDSPFLLGKKYKKTFCPYCETFQDSKHFFRHLTRNHKTIEDVQMLAKTTAKSKERTLALTLIRSLGNMEAAERGDLIPKRMKKGQEISPEDYSPCELCNIYLMKKHLHRHRKRCLARNSPADPNSSAVMSSLVFSACRKKYGKILNSTKLKEEVLSNMRGDEVSEVILHDVLIFSWGDDLLKKTPNNRSKYHLVAKMRRCARLLLEMRKLNPKYTDVLSFLRPDAFDDVIEATKKISRYDTRTRIFGASSTALQLGAYLKQMSDLTKKIVLRKKVELPVENLDSCLQNLAHFKDLVTTQWTTELGSLAMKNLIANAAEKVPLLPLTEDIMKLKKIVDQKSLHAYNEIMKNPESRDEHAKGLYKLLAETTLVSSLLHNRKRAGDVHYFTLKSFENQKKNGFRSQETNEEFTKCLSEGEKLLTQQYIKLRTIGKASQQVPLLVPKQTFKYYELIYSIRKNTPEWFPHVSNNYFFAYPHSKRWICGISGIRKWAKKCKAKRPNLLTTVRLRKHIATVTQILSLKDNDVDQLAKFMGHTRKTHDHFYKLPEDVYQCAKVSKILQMMERGTAAEFKNKGLDEIEINMDEIEGYLLEEEKGSGSALQSIQIANDELGQQIITEVVEQDNTCKLIYEGCSIKTRTASVSHLTTL